MPAPRVDAAVSSIVKPGELVDVVEMSPLTLQDRRIFNMLLGHAWNEIGVKREHTIPRAALTKHAGTHNLDIAGSLRRLMAAIVVAQVECPETGEPELRQVQLLGPTSLKQKGRISYEFLPKLIEIARNTRIFARLQTALMYEFRSQYGLALYEWLMRRKNLQNVTWSSPAEVVRSEVRVFALRWRIGHGQASQAG